jgi:predicted glycoside hydrolase/deacetylase ChbG (UPF0249 family)
MARLLIVNADDFGMSTGVNRGVIRAHSEGIVTSASLLVRRAAAADAVRIARGYPRLSLGIHLETEEWEYRDGEWMVLHRFARGDDVESLRAEVESQLAEFHRLTGTYPTHLDSHQHVHRSEPLLSLVREAGRRLAVPVREDAQSINYRGDFYGQSGKGVPYPQGTTVASLVSIIDSLEEGITELSCHPGVGAGIPSCYCVERNREVDTLCDAGIKDALERRGIVLSSFADLHVCARAPAALGATG